MVGGIVFHQHNFLFTFIVCIFTASVSVNMTYHMHIKFIAKHVKLSHSWEYW